MFDRRVLGLDIGSYSVKAVELCADWRRSEFVRFEEQVLPVGALPEEVEARVRSFLEERGLPMQYVVVALPSEHVTQRHLRLPFRGSRRVAQAIDFQIQEELPFPLEDTIRSHERVELGAEQTGVLVVISARDEVRSCLDAMHRMHVDPRIVDVEGAVLANLSPHLNEGHARRLVLDIGHSKTNLCLLIEGNPILLRRIPIAGHHFTKAIAGDMDLSFEEAEAYKHEHGIFEFASSKPSSPALSCTLDRLVREILRSVQATLSDSLDPVAPSELLLVGGSAELPGLSAYLQEHTGLGLSELSLGDGPRLAVGTSKFAQAAALAQRGAGGKATTRIDFRQNEFAYTADLSALSKQLQVTVALFALMLALWFASTVVRTIISESRVATLQETIASIHRQTFPTSKAGGRTLRELELEFSGTRQLADHLGVTSRGLSVLDALRDISARLPAELDVTFDELRIDRKNITGRGHTRDFASADRIRRELSQIDDFGRVLISDVVSDARRGGKNFTLKIRLEDQP